MTHSLLKNLVYSTGAKNTYLLHLLHKPIILYTIFIRRYFNIVLVDDNEKAWFPAADLKEFHGIMPHEDTAAETLLFCIHADGSEGLCCPTGRPEDDDEDDDIT